MRIAQDAARDQKRLPVGTWYEGSGSDAVVGASYRSPIIALLFLAALLMIGYFFVSFLSGFAPIVLERFS